MTNLPVSDRQVSGKFTLPSWWPTVLIIAVAALTGAVLSLHLPFPLAAAAGLTVFCIGLWGSVALPEYWTALAFLLVASLLGIAPVETIFSGFYSSVFWFFFSGLVLGAAINHTGLGHYVALAMSRFLGRTYFNIVALITSFSVLLAFLVPSATRRIVLLLPIVVALAERVGYGADSKGRTGMLLAATFGTILPAYTILPANAPNLMLVGMAETLFGHSISYWTYLLVNFPVLGLGKAILLVLVILRMFPAPVPLEAQSEASGPQKMTGKQRQLSILVLLCLGFWVTDQLHHIPSAWVGLVGALYCLWPQAGLMAPNAINKDINYGSLFFVTGIMGLAAVITEMGLGNLLVTLISEQMHFAPGQSWWNLALLTGTSSIVGMITNLPGIPAVLIPAAQGLSDITGLLLHTVLMTQVLAFSNVLLPYQAPPLIMATQVVSLSIGALSRLCLLMFVLSALLLAHLISCGGICWASSVRVAQHGYSPAQNFHFRGPRRQHHASVRAALPQSAAGQRPYQGSRLW